MSAVMSNIKTKYPTNNNHLNLMLCAITLINKLLIKNSK